MRTWTLADENGRDPRVVGLGQYAEALERAERTHTASPRLYSLEADDDFAHLRDGRGRIQHQA